MTVGSVAVGRAVQRLAPAALRSIGFAMATAGLLSISLAVSGDSYGRDLLPRLILSGLGNGIIFTSMFIIGTRDAPAAHQGTAGALLTTSQYLAGGITLAVLTLALGDAPDAANFRVAFLTTTAASAAGLVRG